MEDVLLTLEVNIRLGAAYCEGKPGFRRYRKFECGMTAKFGWYRGSKLSSLRGDEGFFFYLDPMPKLRHCAL